MSAHEKSSFITIGVDVGQKHDPTAIAVVEGQLRTEPNPARPGNDKQIANFLVRFLERQPVGTSYPEIAQRVSELCRKVEGRGGRRPIVYIDATGLGTPVVDLIKEGIPISWPVWAVYFTFGDRRTADEDARQVTLGKAFLVTQLQALIQARRIHLPKTAESEILVEELLDYEITVERDANDHYGAFRVGKHDDLVTALGLAVHRTPSWRASVYPEDVIIGGYE